MPFTIAMSGAKQNTLNQSARANNLANVNTTGFRADYAQSRAMGVFGEHFPTRAYAMTERPSSDFRQGPLIETGRRMDVTIEGAGWFAVQGPNGEEAYTPRRRFECRSSRAFIKRQWPAVIG